MADSGSVTIDKPVSEAAVEAKKKEKHRAPLLQAFPALADRLPPGIVNQVDVIDHRFNGHVDPGTAYNLFCMIAQGLYMTGKPAPEGFDYSSMRTHYKL